MSNDKLPALRDLNAEWAACTRCPLHQHRRTTVFADGTPDGPIMFIGEAPGREEDRSGIPFVGPSGRLLSELIERATGRNVDDVVGSMLHMTNAVMCRPKDNRAPTRTEAETCWPRLREQIRIVDPWLIVAVGATALATISGKGTASITKARGEVEDVEIDFPGFGKRRYPVFPIFHPSFLLQKPDMNKGGHLERTREDVQTVFEIIDTLRETYGNNV